MSIETAIHSLGTPSDPRDGDCLEWAPLITRALTNLGYAAEDCLVVGRDADDAIVFMHYATAVGHQVVDCTARQFHPALPLRWVAPVPDYIHDMVRYTGVASVTVAVVE